MPSRFEYLPGIFKFRQYCEEVAKEAQEHARRLAAAKRPRAPYTAPAPSPGCYTGPIELVKPGDILDQARILEYREFMKTKGFHQIRLWGVNERWEDNHARPFAVPDSTIAKHLSEKPEDVSNPFEK